MNIPFSLVDIEDVRVIIKAKGKNWAITCKEEFAKQVVKEIRKEIGKKMLVFHDVVVPALEDIDVSKFERK